MAGSEYQKYSYLRGDYKYYKSPLFNGKDYYVKKSASGTNYKLLFTVDIDNWAVCGILTNNINKCVLKSVQSDGEIGQFFRKYFYIEQNFTSYCILS